MLFMIKRKLIFLSLFLGSCTQIDYSYFQYLRNALQEPGITIDEAFIDSMQYSFVKARQGRNEAVLVLSNIINNDTYVWVGASGETIKTYKGLIIETSNFPSNVHFFKGDIKNLHNLFTYKDFSVSFYADNPELVHQELKFSIHSIDEQETCRLISYEKTAYKLNFYNIDSYCLLPNNLPHFSRQKLTPLQKEIELEFFYKY